MEVIKFREAKYYKKNIQTRGGILSWDKIGFNDVKQRRPRWKTKVQKRISFNDANDDEPCEPKKRTN